VSCLRSQGLATVTGGKQLPPYQPDYTRCAEHFLLHAGGYAILRGIQAGLRWAVSAGRCAVCLAPPLARARHVLLQQLQRCKHTARVQPTHTAAPSCLLGLRLVPQAAR
jgi:hypothetical protein